MNRRKDHKSKPTRASEVVARRKVYLIIDGYNLMHVTRFKPLRQQVGELQRCREGLLALLAERLAPSQYRDITVVFDSRQAPQRLPNRQRYGHLNVVFARHENSADDLIAKMVQDHAHWQQLVVVSSDHRVQRAALRRKATTLDSDEWFDALLEYDVPDDRSDVREGDSPGQNNQPSHVPGEKTSPFEDQGELSEFISEMTQAEERRETGPPKNLDSEDEFENPFPEGYFDDLDEG